MSREELTMAEVSARLDRISQSMAERDRVDAQRRKIDDERNEKAEKAAADVRERLDRHGIRTTTLETNWAAFFGPIGAFTSALTRIGAQGKKIDRLTWLVGIGVGIVGTLQFVLLWKFGR